MPKYYFRPSPSALDPFYYLCAVNYLAVDNISKKHDDAVLFRNVSFGIAKGERVALVGRNGAGKSSLLRILTGEDKPDEGNVANRKGIRISVLEQDPFFAAEMTALEVAISGDHPALDVLRQYRIATEQADISVNLLQSLTEKMEAEKAWDFETRATAILSRLGITDPEAKMGALSGGQQRRAALARMVICEPDLMLLDEPTNHLDTDIIEWLEEYLCQGEKTALLITHDRYFLENVCDKIIELDKKTIFTYEGNFSYFLEKKAARELADDAETSKARNLFRTELEWLRRQPKARTTKSKSRIDAAEELRIKSQRQEIISKLELSSKMPRLGSKIMELTDVSKSFGSKKIFENFTYTFRRKERLGVVGANGSGKTTLLNLIISQIQPDSGTVVPGETIRFGYFNQDGLIFKPGQRVIEVVQEAADEVDFGEGKRMSASQALTMFHFPPERQFMHVEKCSGGEKRRLHLLRVLMKQPNFLILDEPTNDLDLQTLESLEEFLLEFAGCLIIVSHDRYFLDRLAENLLVLEGNAKTRIFPGTYREYIAIREIEEESKLAGKKIESAIPVTIAKTEKKKLSYKEQKEFENLPKEMEALNKRKPSLVSLLESGETDHVKVLAWAKELEEINAALDEKELRWLELGEQSE